MAVEDPALMGGAPAINPSVTDTGTTPQTDNGETEVEEEPVDDSEPVVLCTIMDNRDGTFTLMKGDEGDAGGEDALSGEAAEGMPPAQGGVAAQPKGESFDSPGPLLKAVLDILKDAEDRVGGSAQSNFQAGFDANKEAKPKAY